jgi:hypothetical protein
VYMQKDAKSNSFMSNALKSKDDEIQYGTFHR